MMGRDINKIQVLLKISAVITALISFGYSQGTDLIIPEQMEEELVAYKDQSVLKRGGNTLTVLSSGAL